MLIDDKPRVGSQALRFESNIQSGPGFTSNSCLAMFHFSGLRFDWYVVLVDDYCTNPETTFLCLLHPRLTARAIPFEERRDYSPMWLNLTGSELKLHAVSPWKYCFLQGENAPGRIIYATGRCTLTNAVQWALLVKGRKHAPSPFECLVSIPASLVPTLCARGPAIHASGCLTARGQTPNGVRLPLNAPPN